MREVRRALARVIPGGWTATPPVPRVACDEAFVAVLESLPMHVPPSWYSVKLLALEGDTARRSA